MNETETENNSSTGYPWTVSMTPTDSPEFNICSAKLPEGYTGLRMVQELNSSGHRCGWGRHKLCTSDHIDFESRVAHWTERVRTD